MKKLIAFFAFIILSISAKAADFRFVDLSSHVNMVSHFRDLSLGHVTFADIPYYIPETGYSFVNSQYSGDNLGPHYPTHFNYDIGVKSVDTLYLLFNGGNLYNQWMDKQIGRIVLTYTGGSSEIPLIVGNNIREWAPNSGNIVDTLTDPNVTQAYFGALKWEPFVGRIDRYEISFPDPVDLIRMEVFDESLNQNIGPDSGITVYGMTVRATSVPEPDSWIAWILLLACLGAIKLARRNSGYLSL